MLMLPSCWPVRSGFIQGLIEVQCSDDTAAECVHSTTSVFVMGVADYIYWNELCEGSDRPNLLNFMY